MANVIREEVTVKVELDCSTDALQGELEKIVGALDEFEKKTEKSC